MEDCNIASLCSRMASEDNPSTLSLLGVNKLPLRVSQLIMFQQLLWAMGYLCLTGSIVHKGKYVGMPFAAVVLNFGWEMAFGMFWTQRLGWEAHGHRGWMLLNFAILYQYAQTEYFSSDGKSTILWSKMAYNAILSVSIWTLLAAFVMETEDYSGLYSSYLVRFMTSVLTMHQLLTQKENPATFEALVPGACRLLSTLCASLAFGKITNHSILLSTLYIACFVWDTLYVIVAIFRNGQQPTTSSSKSKSE